MNPRLQREADDQRLEELNRPGARPRLDFCGEHQWVVTYGKIYGKYYGKYPLTIYELWKIYGQLWFIMAICIVNNGVFFFNVMLIVMLIVMLMDVNGC